MDAYYDKDMGDVIVGKLFYKASCVEARRFDGLITIHAGISYPYQKHKSFYKGVLNLGPGYIRYAKTVEWLIHGYVSMPEME
uniref:Uncharacterized protein n=1 Tax=Tanacetum cinerariifolium TaxID=118510 RepID=A0A699UIJ9_TANCI|nr:hypothetical protein [Tanacetum cinerariifolium]